MPPVAPACMPPRPALAVRVLLSDRLDVERLDVERSAAAVRDDADAVYADPALALRELGWRATRGLDEMCRDAWRWQSDITAGYGTVPPSATVAA